MKETANTPLFFLGVNLEVDHADLRKTIEAWDAYIAHQLPQLDTYPDLRPSVITTLLLRAMARYVLAEYRETLADCQQIREFAGTEREILASYLIEGGAHGELGQDEQAITAWSHVLAAFERAKTERGRPFSSQLLYLYRGLLYTRREQYQEAVADCDRAEAYLPDCAEIYSIRGLAYSHLGQHERGPAECTRSLELEPENAHYLQHRSAVHRHMRHARQALEDITRAKDLDPENTQILSDYFTTILTCARTSEPGHSR